MPQIGDIAPDFELLNQDGKPVRLSDFRGRKVVIFVFPKADSLGCNMQACGFRDEFETIAASNAVVLAIGADSVDAMRAWKAKKNLPYDVLSDPKHVMMEPWGAFGLSMLGLIRLPIPQRAYWVIDENGRVIDAKVPVMPGDSVKRALEAVKIQVVPA
jgi:peroxiredoxin Q/BCP